MKGQAPFSESLQANGPVAIDYTPTFVDGIGGPHIEPAMWELSSDLLAGSLEVTLAEVAATVRLLVSSNRIVAEGAGASSVAAGLSGTGIRDKVVCVVSGGNLDPAKLATILAGGVP